MRVTTCKSCGAPIVWIKTIGGKSMPCDAEEVYYIQRQNGAKRIVTPNGEVLACKMTDIPEKATGVGYVPHWSTCTAPEQFRRQKK